MAYLISRLQQLMLFQERLGALRGLTSYIHCNLARSRYRLRTPEYGNLLELRTTPSSDIVVYRSVFLHRDYQLPSVIAGFKPRTIVDAGANCGFSTVWFAERYPEATIHAIEPDEGNFEQLKRNTSGFSNIRNNLGALWHKPGSVVLSNPEARHFSFRVTDAQSPTEGVPAITPEDLLRQAPEGRIDLLKIDIEGAERDLLQAYPELCRRSRVILIETHDRSAPGSSQALFEALQGCRYNLVPCNETLQIWNPDVA